MQVMQKHQKYIAVRDENGSLLPYFIAVRHSLRSYMSFDVIFCFIVVVNMFIICLVMGFNFRWQMEQLMRLWSKKEMRLY